MDQIVYDNIVVPIDKAYTVANDNSFYFSVAPASSLPSHYITMTVSVHFNHFYCMEICDKLSRYLYMSTYIYISMLMSVD